MHPIFIYITDNFFIGTYGVLVALGVFAGIFTAIRRTRKLGIPDDFIFDLTFYMVIAGIIGSRILFIIINWKMFLEDPLSLILSREGFVFLGGFAAAALVGIYFIRKNKYPFFIIADALAPSVPLGHFFGRLGCFSAGCCYGKVCSKGYEFLGVHFPAVYNRKGELIGSFPYIDHLNHNLIPQTANQSLPIIPIQLIEAAGNFIIFLILNKMYKNRKFDGYITGLYLFIYAGMRFFIEFLRGDADRRIWLGLLSTSQILSLIAIGFGLWVFYKIPRTPTTLIIDKKQIIKKKKK